MKQSKPLHILGSICRTLLGLTFIFSGFVKAIDPLGTTYKIEDYLKAFGGIFMDMMPLAMTAAIVMITFEFALGVCLLCNVRTNITSWLALLFLLVMTPLTLYIALENPVTDCGCFGDAVKLSNWATFWKNIVLLVLVLILLFTKRHIHQTFTWWAELTFLVLALAAMAGVMGYSLTHLPFIDFRPYKIGNNLPALMEIPDDAPHDEYAVTFIYEKDGVQQEFTLDNYPKGDSTWTFVNQKSVLVQKGYEPAIHDFELLNSDFEDLTFDILESETPVTLVIMYDIAKTDLAQQPKVQALREQCLANDQPFYILTGSDEQTIETFFADSDISPEDCVLTCDGVTLKTIVRANPGVVVLQNGTVTDKYNLRNK
ncbi:MAG: BT_3928 family protein [Paludibacteraceae bacterium]